MKWFILSILLFCFTFLSAQDMKDYSKSWEGQLGDSDAFNFHVEIENLNDETAVIKIVNQKKSIIYHEFVTHPGKVIQIPINDHLYFEGEFNADKSSINGFIRSGMLLYHIQLLKSNPRSYVGTWNILILNHLKSNAFYLSIENGKGENYEAYPTFGDNRFTGTWCDDFKKDKDSIFFYDYKTGLNFKGLLGISKIVLDINLGASQITQIEMRESNEEWKIETLSTENQTIKPPSLDDGWKIAKINHLLNQHLLKMEEDIKANALENTHSVVIARDNKIVYEKYFLGYDNSVPHDMRSASKSISSAIVGISIDKKLITSERGLLFELLPTKYQSAEDTLKRQISIHSLLTMSSGLDAIDFGIKRESYATEDNYQQQNDYTKYILQAPMIAKPGTHANYGSANAYLLGVIVDGVLSEPLELFMDKSLFQKLGITDYIIQTDENGLPYFGGGMYLTPRDMLKFGQLYLNLGKWNKRQVLSSDWISKSFNHYLILENANDKNEYGYLWWHKTYIVNGQSIQSIEARGAGGQYIFVIPKLGVVVVITSSNFRNGKYQQPEKILNDYILPALLN